MDLGAIRANLRRFRRKVGSGRKVLFVVKADGYGHGALAAARLAQSEKADWLGVSSVEEGAALRRAGIALPILILGSLYPFDSLEEAAARDLTPTVASPDAARALAEFRRRRNRPLACHLKVDTGMHRIGMSPAALPRALEALEPGAVAGVYTHLSSADVDRDYTLAQLASFASALKAAGLARKGGVLRHAANSAAALGYPAARLDMVRPGLALYGLVPGFEPALSLKTRVVFVKRVAKGARVGYGGRWRARRASRIATLPVGYADGYPRNLWDRAEVLLGGRRAPLAGAVSMDMMTVDATDLPSCRVGDEAVLLGRQGGEEVSAIELAALAGTIPYEVVARLGARVPREYLA